MINVQKKNLNISSFLFISILLITTILFSPLEANSVADQTGLTVYVNPSIDTAWDANYRDVTDTATADDIAVGAEKTFNTANTYSWVEMDSSPTDGDRAIAILHEGAINKVAGSGDLIAQIYDKSAGTWSSETALNTDGISLTIDPQSFDIEFETTTGEALVVYGLNSGDKLQYRTLADDSSTWSSASDVNGSGGDFTDIWWVSLHRDPSSDDIMLVWEQSIAGGAFLQTSLWDGSSWGAVTDHGETVLIDALKLTKDFDFAWEGDRGEGVLVWFECEDGAGTCNGGVGDGTSDIEYNTWTSGTWDTQGTVVSAISTSSKQGQVVMATEYEGIHDKIGLAYIAGNDKRLHSTIWDNTSWSTIENLLGNAQLVETGKGGKGNANMEWQYGIGDLYLVTAGKPNTPDGIELSMYDESAGTWDTTGLTIYAVTQPKGAPTVATDPNSNAVLIGWTDEKTIGFPKNIEYCDTNCHTAGGWSHTELINDPDTAQDAKTQAQSVDVVFFDGTESSGSTHELTPSESNEGSDGHTITKEIFLIPVESNEGSDSHSISIDSVFEIPIAELNEGSDAHEIIIGKNLAHTELNEGSDGHTINKEIFITAGEVMLGVDLTQLPREIFLIVTESNEGSDTGIVSKVIEVLAVESVEGSDAHNIIIGKNISATESVEGVDGHTITKEIFLIPVESVEGSDVSVFSNIISISVSESNEGSDVSIVSKVIEVLAVELIEGSDVHDITQEINITAGEVLLGVDLTTINQALFISATESVEGSDATLTSVETIHYIYATESNEGSDVQMVITIGYHPEGKYIWFNVAPPETDRLGGVYSLECDSGFYVSGILTNGTLICTELPPP